MSVPRWPDAPLLPWLGPIVQGLWRVAMAMLVAGAIVAVVAWLAASVVDGPCRGGASNASDPVCSQPWSP